MFSRPHEFPTRPTDAEANILGYLSPGKVFFVAILVTGTWAGLKWARGFLDGLEKHNPRLHSYSARLNHPSE